jgi:hypothetical protein
MEIFFDFKESISGLLDVNQFNTFETTLYSKDYKYYQGNGSKRQSLLCIYKKADQLRDVKNVKFCDIDTRVEVRLQKQNFQRLLNSLDILDGNFEEILSTLKKHLIKRLKKLKIDFRKLIRYLDDTNPLKEILMEADCLGRNDSKKVNENVSSRGFIARYFKCYFLSKLLIKILYCVIKTFNLREKDQKFSIAIQARGP